MKTIAIIDDNLIDAKCIEQWCLHLPNTVVIKHFNTGFDAINHAQTFEANILIVDMHLPLLCGLDTISLLRTKNYRGKIIGTSHAFRQEHKSKLIDLGANGYCQKERASLQRVLSIVISNGCAYTQHDFEEWKSSTHLKKLHEKDEDDRIKLLNPHYKKILLYTYQGLNTAEMSEKMGLKKHTIEQYRSGMLQQLGFKNMCQAAAWAILHKIIVTSELPPPHTSILTNKDEQY
jgi:NarL family two-component system response regulator LiaR